MSNTKNRRFLAFLGHPSLSLCLATKREKEWLRGKARAIGTHAYPPGKESFPSRASRRVRKGTVMSVCVKSGLDNLTPPVKHPATL